MATPATDNAAEELTLSTSEAAAALGCSRQNVDDLVRRGRLAVAKPGPRRTIRIVKESVAAYAAARDHDNPQETRDSDVSSQAAPAGTSPEPGETPATANMSKPAAHKRGGDDAEHDSHSENLAKLAARVDALERAMTRPLAARATLSSDAQADTFTAGAAPGAATLLAVSVTIQDALRDALTEADLAADLVTQAVQASLRSKAALHRADRIRDEAVRQFGYPTAPPGDM